MTRRRLAIDRTVDERIDTYHRLGWCPVPWAHHPPRVRAAIRAAAMRPQIKQCFANSQRLLLRQDVTPFVYVEGVVTTGLIPFEHAWLRLDGDDVDVTLTGTGTGRVVVLAAYEVPKSEVISRVVKRGTFGPVRADYLEALRSAVLFNVPLDGVTDGDTATLAARIRTHMAALTAMLTTIAEGARDD